jgi:DNA-binding GntR family transcriptional regulator
MTTFQELAGRAFAARRSTPGLIADSLRAGMLDGRIGGGQKLIQRDLARAFGTSRIPIREALRQLESEGLIDYHPHRGAVVAPLTAPEIKEIYEMRMPLEVLALRLAIPKLDAHRLTAARRAIDDSAGAANVAKFGGLNWRFHEALYEAADRPRLLKAIRNLYIHASRWASFEKHQRRSFTAIIAEHREILRACERRNVRIAVSALERHLAASQRLLLKYIAAS